MVIFMEKKEMLAEVKVKVDAIIIKDFNKEGAMMQYNSSGEVKGRYHGNHIETVDALFKMDGTSEWESRGMDMTKDGDLIMMTAKGTGRSESATTSSFKGEVTYMTNAPRLSWLNNMKGWVEGMMDLKNGQAEMKVYAEQPQATIAAPMM